MLDGVRDGFVIARLESIVMSSWLLLLESSFSIIDVCVGIFLSVPFPCGDAGFRSIVCSSSVVD